ncbi:MAG: hypothetical protein GX431_00185 [Bacteroidales bacterium]|jgi:hypothetical protein|nr:hypothetical protein [Bacteroidales bacterium]
MKEFIKKHLLIIVFIIAGGVAGFLYWKFVGCLSGTCIIKSVWYMSTIYGMGVGWILGSLTGDMVESFKKRKKA